MTAARASGSSRIGQLGKGAVQLIEIPTDDEIHDNVVAMWVPEKPASGRPEFDLSLPAPLARR